MTIKLENAKMSRKHLTQKMTWYFCHIFCYFAKKANLKKLLESWKKKEKGFPLEKEKKHGQAHNLLLLLLVHYSLHLVQFKMHSFAFEFIHSVIQSLCSRFNVNVKL